MRLYQFLLDAGDRPYRELVRHHFQRQSAAQLRDAATGEVSALPKELQPLVESYFDELNERLLVRRDFWRKSTCRDAVNAVLALCNEHFNLSFELPVNVDRMSGVEQELAFGLFQMATLSFGYTAVDQARAREFMGIPTRFPWPSAVALLYPLAAVAWMYQQATANGHASPVLLALGYGLSNLGYLLLASGLIFGKFGALKLRSRATALGTGLAALLLGILITNV
jgi:hypothetical protein